MSPSPQGLWRVRFQGLASFLNVVSREVSGHKHKGVSGRPLGDLWGNLGNFPGICETCGNSLESSRSAPGEIEGTTVGPLEDLWEDQALLAAAGRNILTGMHGRPADNFGADILWPFVSWAIRRGSLPALVRANEAFTPFKLSHLVFRFFLPRLRSESEFADFARNFLP